MQLFCSMCDNFGENELIFPQLSIIYPPKLTFPYLPLVLFVTLLADAIFLLAVILDSDSTLFINQLRAMLCNIFREFRIPLDNTDFRTDHKQLQIFLDNIKKRILDKKNLKDNKYQT